MKTILAGDTILVSQDRYNKDLLFDIQRHSNIVDAWIVRRRNLTNIANKTKSRTSVKTYQDQLGEIIKSKVENVSTNHHETKGNNNDPNILLIDDEEDLLTVYKLFLSSAGYMNLKAFTNPREGLKHVVDLKDPSYYDLAILNIRTKDINGIQIYHTQKSKRFSCLQ